MNEYDMKLVAIVIKGSSPSKEEELIINSLGAKRVKYCNGRFAKATSSEKIDCTSLLNLSGNKDLDKFYEDILIDLDVHLQNVAKSLEAISVKKEIELEIVEKEEPKELSKKIEDLVDSEEVKDITKDVEVERSEPEKKKEVKQKTKKVKSSKPKSK